MAKNRVRSKTKRRAQSIGDTVDVSRVGEGSAVAAGRNAKAIVINFARGNPVLLWIVLSILVGAIALLAYLVLHHPRPKMTGEFNIAVAGFSTTQGKGVDLGKEIAAVFARRLQLELSKYSAQNNAVAFDVLLPDETGTIEGGNAIQRSNSAITLARGINADVVLYGTVEEQQNGDILVSPEFVVTSRFIKDAEEALGQYKLGSSITIQEPETSLSARLAFNRELADRASALSFMTLGLFNYFTQDYKQALHYYGLADALENWTDGQGKEVLYILMGNASIKQDDFVQAQRYYQRAINVNAAYSRGYIGLATVIFREAISDSGKVDYPNVFRAVDVFKRALAAKDKPDSSYVDLKAHFGLGEANLLLAQAGKSNSLTESQEDFQYVIAQFEQNPDPVLYDRVAESEAHLGLIAYIKGAPMSQVEQYYQKAAGIAAKYDKSIAAEYLETAAKLYVKEHDPLSARRVLQQAITDIGDSEARNNLEQLLATLELTPTP